MNKTIRKIGAAMLLCTMGLAAHAQTNIVFDNKKNHVGEIMFQTPKTVVFSFKNKSKKTLQIIDVKPMCGCTEAQWTHGDIAAGASGQITVVYDAKMLGTFRKEVAVYTTASNEPIYLEMEGRVVTERVNTKTSFPIDLGNVQINTNYIEFDNVNRGDKPVAELMIANQERTPYRPSLMHLPSYLSAEYLPEVIAGGRVGRVRITLDSEKLGLLGLNQTRIYLSRRPGDKVGEANEILVSSVLLPAFSNMTADQLAIAPKMVLSQEELTFNMTGKKKQTQTVTIHNTGKQPLNIRSVQVFNQALEVSVSDRTIDPGKSATMKVTVLSKYMKKAKNRPRVLLITNDPSRAKQTINVTVNE